MESSIENQMKEVASGLPAPKPNKKVKNWTLLFVGDHGKILSVKNFMIWAKIIVLALLIAIATSVGLYFMYNDTFVDNEILKNKLKVSKHKLSKLHREKDEILKRVVVAESKLEVIMEENREKASPETKIETAPLVEAAVTPKEPPLEPKPVDIVKAQPQLEKNETVTVGDMTSNADQNGKTLHIRFKIKNTTKNSKPVSGYCFVILKGDGVGQSEWVSVPDAELADGRPVTVKKGKRFTISFFKTLKFKVSTQEPLNKFTKATVVVFGKSEKILLEKDFSIEREIKFD